MPLSLHDGQIRDWQVKKIDGIGPGIVGLPMAALPAHPKITEGKTAPAKVVVVQRNSPTSGWKVSAINSGHSPIGGVEPELDRIVAESVKAGTLSASTEYSAVRDA